MNFRQSARSTRTSVASDPRDDEGRLAGVPSGLNFLAVVWLLIVATSFDYNMIPEGYDGRWNDLVVGSAIAAVALARAIAPRSVPWFSWVNVALGGWLVAAPLALDYGTPSVMVNDIIVGSVVVVLALLSMAISRHARSQPRLDPQPGDSSRFE